MNRTDALDLLAGASVLLQILGFAGILGVCAAAFLGVFEWGLDVDLAPPSEDGHV